MQKDVVLRYLKENGSITTLECMQKLFILDLQSAIRYLRQDGYNIKDRWISKKNIYGTTSTFKEYYLEE